MTFFKGNSKMYVRAVAALITVLFLMSCFVGCNNDTDKDSKNAGEKPTVLFKEDLTAQIGGTYTVGNFVDTVTNGTLSNSETPIDASKIGKVEATVQVLNEKSNETVEFPFEVDVVDTQGPALTVPDTISVQIGEKADLLKDVIAEDNSGETIVPTVSGEYDLKKAGDYTLTVTAQDSSGNTATAKTVLKVTAKKTAETTKTPAKPQQGLPKKAATQSVIKKAKNYSMTYWVVIYREACTVVVYTADEKGEYTVPVRVSVCSPGSGNNTTLGTFKMSAKYRWCTLIGPCYGQYSIRFNGHILFHSVPYQERDNTTLKYWLYNRLGRKDSLGCVRLTTADAKWLYDNCAIGTSVTVTSASLPSGIYKPSAKYIPSSDKRRGWDPTDPDPKNPWGKYVDPNPPVQSKTDSSSKASSTSKVESSSKSSTSVGSSQKPASSSEPQSSTSSTGSETSGNTSSSTESTSSEDNSSQDTTSGEE